MSGSCTKYNSAVPNIVDDVLHQRRRAECLRISGDSDLFIMRLWPSEFKSFKNTWTRSEQTLVLTSSAFMVSFRSSESSPISALTCSIAAFGAAWSGFQAWVKTATNSIWVFVKCRRSLRAMSSHSEALVEIIEEKAKSSSAWERKWDLQTRTA